MMYKDLIKQFETLYRTKLGYNLKEVVNLYNNKHKDNPLEYKTINKAINQETLKVDTLCKLLEVLGYKLQIVDLNDKAFSLVNSYLR